MKIRKYLILIFFLFLLFPIVKEVKINLSNPKDVKKELKANNGPTIIPFKVGVEFELQHLDPHYAWDSSSFDIIDQVCEGLFRYNLSHPSNEIIPSLADQEGLWRENGKEFWVSLRQGITFHDGSKFNASAVKWSFDRLLYLTNLTGTQPFGSTLYGESVLKLLYTWPDGTPIIKEIKIFNEYTIIFNLTRPYGAFKALLCFPGSYILSPLSTPATDYLDTTTDDLVGTGPFVYGEYITNANVTFYAYENYWRGKANIDKMVFEIIKETPSRNLALLNGDIHFLEEPHPSYLDTFKANNTLTVIDSGKPDCTVHYLGMNNVKFNNTWKRVISWAIDYDSMINDILGGAAIRLTSPIPPGIQFANESFDVPTFNLTKARGYMVSMGFGSMSWTDQQWIDKANSDPFRIVNYSYNLGYQFREDFFTLLMNNLTLIGVRVVENGLEGGAYTDLLYNNPNELELFWQGWIPDFNDPSNYFNFLMKNTSIFNFAQINDPYLETLLEQGLNETDSSTREAIYDETQQYLVEGLIPLVWSHVEKVYTAHHNNLTGFQQNGLSILDFYSCKWNPYNYEIDINSPADITFMEGTSGYDIRWNMSAQHFLNPTYNITVNGFLNVTNSWQSGVPIIVNLDSLSPGIYTYQITAKNGDKIVQDIVIVSVILLTINHPEDITFTKGTTGITITWAITTNLELDTNYNITVNDVFFDSNSWHSGIPVIVNLDNLSIGSYEYRIEVFNGDFSIEDSVIVNVKARPQEEGITIILITLGVAGGVGAAVIIAIYLIRRRSK